MMDVAYEQERITKLIDVLGDTSNDIADSLRQQGQQGFLQSAARCVVAQYLQKETGHKVTVSYDHIVIAPRDCTQYARVKTPGSIVNFIKAFDDGLFPDLIQTIRHLTP